MLWGCAAQATTTTSYTTRLGTSLKRIGERREKSSSRTSPFFKAVIDSAQPKGRVVLLACAERETTRWKGLYILARYIVYCFTRRGVEMPVSIMPPETMTNRHRYIRTLSQQQHHLAKETIRAFCFFFLSLPALSPRAHLKSIYQPPPPPTLGYILSTTWASRKSTRREILCIQRECPHRESQLPLYYVFWFCHKIMYKRWRKILDKFLVSCCCSLNLIH